VFCCAPQNEATAAELQPKEEQLEQAQATLQAQVKGQLNLGWSVAS
jgi:hypothetical protein